MSETVSALRFARSEARRTSSYVGLRVAADGGGFNVFALDLATNPNTERLTVRDPATKALYSVNLAAGSLTGGAAAAPDFRFGSSGSSNPVICFGPTGMPVSPVDLVAMASGVITLQYRGDSRVVTVLPGNGKVKGP